MRLRLLVVTASFLTACVATEQTKLSTLAEGCLINSDCANPLVCAFRRCHTQCSESRDCPPGSACRPADRPYDVCLLLAPLPNEVDCVRDSQCVGSLVCGVDGICRSECVVNRDCLTGQVCTQGVCAEPSELVNSVLHVKADGGATSCNYNSDCPGGQLCPRGRCVDACALDVDCAAGARCQTGRCLAPDAGTADGCEWNSQCPAPQVCSATGRCIPQCQVSRDCANGQSCVAQSCVTVASDAGCALNSDCPLPLVCGRSASCVPQCLTDRDCAAVQVCATNDGGVGGTCRSPGSTATDAGAACTYTSECPVSLRCTAQGRCAPECLQSRDCPPGAVCTLKTDGGEGGSCDVVPSAAPDGGLACTYTSDCPPTFKCSGAAVCVPECIGDRDCPTGYVCALKTDGGVGGACRLITGTPGAPCSLKTDCTGALVCLAGKCSVECRGDTDCGAGCCVAATCYPTVQCGTRLPDGGFPVTPAPDAGLQPDGGPRCAKDLDCQDQVFCNGFETCVLGICRAAGRTACDDSNPCTVDTCSESLLSCSYSSTLTDADGDGHYPPGCGATADDCDDADPFTWGGPLPAPERCDFKDNNCNGAVDEGLWSEKPGSRQALTVGSLYSPTVGGPRVRRYGNDLFVAVASDGTTRGSLDLYKVDATNLSSVTGPFAAAGSTTAYSSCVNGAGTQATRRAGLPGLEISDGGELMVTGVTRSYLSATCCALPVTVNAVYARTNTSFSALDAGDITVFSEANGICKFLDTLQTNPPTAKWLPQLGKWAFIYLQGSPNRDLYVTLLDGQGAFTTPKRMLDGTGSYPTASIGGPNSQAIAQTFPQMAVSPGTVLVAWQQNPTNWPRYALFSPDFQALVAGPFDLVGTSSEVEDAWFDGNTFVLLQATSSSNSAGTLYRVDAATGVRLAGTIPLPANTGASGVTNETLIAQWRTNVVTVSQGRGLVAAVTQGTNLDFSWGLNRPDAGMMTVDIAFGAGNTHSDFGIAPLDDKNVALFWTDGDLKRLVMECKP